MKELSFREQFSKGIFSVGISPFPLENTDLSFQEIIYIICNLFYGTNLKVLHVEIAISRLADQRNEDLRVFGIFIKRAFKKNV